MRSDKKNSIYKKTLIFGVLSIGLYAVVFVNQGVITDLFTKGKYYAVLPIITAFIFSYIHGSFANYFLGAIGLVAKK